jgi:hypothetical protein
MALDDCAAIKSWDAVLPSEKLDVVQDLVARMFNDFGLDIPNVVNGPVQDLPQTPNVDESQFSASYNPDTNELRISPTLWDDYGSVSNEAGHEFAHAIFRDLFGDDADVDSPEWKADSEDFADSFGDIFGDMLEDFCDPEPPQSPGTPVDDTPDWNLPEGTAIA